MNFLNLRENRDKFRNISPMLSKIRTTLYNLLSTKVTSYPLSHIDYRPDIDGLRAIAVLAVLAFHAFPTVLTGGFVGVDVFFVISGYLISKVILTKLGNGTFSLSNFYSRRIRRIFPALTVVLISVLAFGWHALLAEDYSLLGKHVLAASTFVSNLALWNEAGYFDKASIAKPLLHLWSLGIEEQFYVVWPLLLYAGWRLRIPGFSLIVGIGALSFAVNLLGINDYATATFYSPLSRSWELIMGGVLAQQTLHQGNTYAGRFGRLVARICEIQTVKSIMSGGGLFLIVYSMSYIDSSSPFPGKWAFVPAAGACLIIAAGSGTWLNGRVLSSRPMVAVGLISFPLYLWHWPLLTMVGNLYPEGMSWRIRLALLVMSFLLAWLTYLLIEKPFRFGAHARAKVFLLCTLMCLIAGAAGFVLKGDGIVSRYPEIVRRATEYDLDGYRAALRNRLCFMDLGQDATQYAPECVDAGEAPLWVLWGDSGAAAVYPGFRSLADSNGQFRLAQFTSSGCPPILRYQSTYNVACNRNNIWTIAKIRELKPDTVVLAGMWGGYDKDGLAETIEELYEAGTRKVILLGPTPAWKDTPSRIVFSLWSADPLHRVPSARLKYDQYGLGAGEQTATAEKILQEISKESDAYYVSVIEKMCNKDGCLMRDSSLSGNSFYLDQVHLNQHGANFVVKSIAGDLLEDNK